MKPIEQAGLAEAPQVVRQQGQTYYGIHEFVPTFAWSADSQRIVFIDCLYNWTPSHPASSSAGDGVESGRRCSLMVISISGQAAAIPLSERSLSDLGDGRISWIGARQVSLEIQKSKRIFTLP